MRKRPGQWLSRDGLGFSPGQEVVGYSVVQPLPSILTVNPGSTITLILGGKRKLGF